MAAHTAKIHTLITLGIRNRTKPLVLKARKPRPCGVDSHRQLHSKAVSGLNRRRFAVGYNRAYTLTMKTAISIPDAIFEEAERLAKIRGWSRSELYSNAVSAYVKSERFLGVREKLDAVYGQNVDDSAVDPLLAKAQARSLPKEKW